MRSTHPTLWCCLVFAQPSMSLEETLLHITLTDTNLLIFLCFFYQECHPPTYVPAALNGATFSVKAAVAASKAVMDGHQNPSLPHHILCKYQFIRRRRKQPNMNPGSPHNGLLGPGQDHVVWCLTRLQDSHPRPLVVADHVWERSHQQRSPRARGDRNGPRSVSSRRCLQYCLGVLGSCLGVTVHHKGATPASYCCSPIPGRWEGPPCIWMGVSAPCRVCWCCVWECHTDPTSWSKTW